MADWKQVITHFAAGTEKQFDEFRYRLYYSLGGPGPIKIIPYRGYGTPRRLYLKGRVIEDKNISEAGENDHLWNNLLNMYKRLESDEVPHAKIVARFQNIETQVTADEEGFFEIVIEPRAPITPHRLWQPIELELLAPRSDAQPEPVRATGDVLVPPDTARYIVISDIDDTVMRTDAVHMLKMARNVFLGNARTRLPFPGVAALYRAFLSGKTGSDMNPLFYLSSSPWNLYDLLSQFFNLNDIPLGPVLFLRDWGISEEELLPIKHRAHKLKIIHEMLDFYPNLPFILVGDSGQEDPEIYAEVAAEYPKRILAAYIRNVSRDLKRPEAIRALAENVIKAGSSLVLADDSLAIANHAVGLNLITAESLPSIKVEKKKDEAPPTPIEKLLDKQEKVETPTVKVEAQQHAIQQGEIEQAVKETGKEETKKAPTVVVETPETKAKAAQKTRKTGKDTH